MDIGPISGIRPVAMGNAAERAPEMKGVFAVEFRREEEDESYSPSKASRGLEEDDAEEAKDEEPAEAGGAAARTISFFA